LLTSQLPSTRMEEPQSLLSQLNQAQRLTLQPIQPEVDTLLLDGLAMKLSLMPTHFRQLCHQKTSPCMRNGRSLRL
jgi:hypothetical protein